MATKLKKRRKSCKHGKLKRPVRIKKGGKRRCKKSKSKRKRKRKSYKMQNNPSTKLEYMPNEMIISIFKNSSLDELANLYHTNHRLRDIAIYIVRTKFSNDEKEKELFMASRSKINTVRLLLDVGINPNIRDEEGQTPLMIASHRNQIDIARMLIEKGADVNVQNKSDHTPLMFASVYGHTEVARMLIENGADVNAKDY